MIAYDKIAPAPIVAAQDLDLLQRLTQYFAHKTFAARGGRVQATGKRHPPALLVWLS